MNKIGGEGGGEHVYAVGQLSIGERARAREKTRRGTRHRKRESASVREGTCNCTTAKTHQVQAAEGAQTGRAVRTSEHDEPVKTKESITGCANDAARVCKHRRGDVGGWRAGALASAGSHL